MKAIHNIMEDLVFTAVNKFYDEFNNQKPNWLECTCPQCRFDTMCYVLNRVHPRYIKSGRGLAHFIQPADLNHEQLLADIAALTVEGAKQVAKNRRPHDHEQESVNSPVFNFPAITGRILDGKTFVPVSNIDVCLKIANSPVEQINGLWANPYTISEKTAGTFTFLPKYVKATDAGLNEVFPFSIVVDASGYEPINYYFKVGVQSSAYPQTEVSMQNCFKLPDLFLF